MLKKKTLTCVHGVSWDSYVKIGCHKFDRRKILIEEELTKPTVLIIPPKFNKFSIKKVSEIKQELRQVETTLSNIHKEGELPAT